jgi:hypothetical protein
MLRFVLSRPERFARMFSIGTMLRLL